MAIIVLKEWRVKLVDNPKPLILYSDEDLANLDKLLMNSISIEPTGRCGLGTDGKNTYDGHPSRGLVRTSKGMVLEMCARRRSRRAARGIGKVRDCGTRR